jgi:hypothetical protein
MQNDIKSAKTEKKRVNTKAKGRRNERKVVQFLEKYALCFEPMISAASLGVFDFMILSCNFTICCQVKTGNYIPEHEEDAIFDIARKIDKRHYILCAAFVDNKQRNVFKSLSFRVYKIENKKEWVSTCPAQGFLNMLKNKKIKNI